MQETVRSKGKRDRAWLWYLRPNTWTQELHEGIPRLATDVEKRYYR